MASSAACECGAENQTVDHVVLQCQHSPFALGLLIEITPLIGVHLKVHFKEVSTFQL